MNIANLELSTRLRNALPQNMSIEDFLQITEQSIRQRRNLGRKSWLEIKGHQENLLGPSRQDLLERLKHDLRDLHRRARQMGLSIVTHEGTLRFARIYGP